MNMTDFQKINGVNDDYQTGVFQQSQSPLMTTPSDLLIPMQKEGAIADADFNQLVNAQMGQTSSNFKLGAIRARNPFLVIEPMPDKTAYVVLNNSQAQFNIPAAAKFMRVNSANALSFLSDGQIPALQAVVPVVNTVYDDFNAVPIPANGRTCLIYCEGKQSMNVGSLGNPTVVVEFFIQL